MNYLENYKLSNEAQARLNNILSEFEPDELSSDWCTLIESNKKSTSFIIKDFSFKMDIDCTEYDSKKLENFKNLLVEALESNDVLSDNSLPGLSSDAYNKIFSEIKNNLDELKFLKLCEFIASWKNDILIEAALKEVILPKLQEKKESSAYIIFAAAKLASDIPDKFCNVVFIPLLTDPNIYFSDIELMSNVFSKLPPACKETILLYFTQKCKFQESDWLLLQPIVKEFSKNNIIMVIKCIQKHSFSFTKSQIFGKFLVTFCKNLNFLDNKESLLEAVNTHQTLLKRQALKYLEKLD